MQDKKYIAIVFTFDKKVFRYHTKERSLTVFFKWVKDSRKAKYVNLYDTDRKFVKRIYIE